MSLRIKCLAAVIALCVFAYSALDNSYAADEDSSLQVTVSGMHLCCGACVKAVEKAVAKVDGIKASVEKEERKTILTGKSKEQTQKALNAMAEAGFVGKLSSKEVAFKKVQAPEGNVKRLEFAEVHNCCGGCSSAIKKAIATVEGAEANTVIPKETSFVVEGDFKAQALVDALLASGFYFQLKP